MKNKDRGFVERVMSVVAAFIKAKTMAEKSKSNAIKAWAAVVSLLKNSKALLPSVSGKLNRHPAGDPGRTVVVYNALASEAPANETCYAGRLDDDDSYPDLTHTHRSFDQSEEDNGTESVSGFCVEVEEEMDRAADVFIRRLYRSLQLQKMESF